jgi:SAM-dependent methyltransferase
MTTSSYSCPFTKAALQESKEGLIREEGVIFPYVRHGMPDAPPIPNFLALQKTGDGANASLEMYENDTSGIVYRNFLTWLFETFNTDDATVRRDMLSRLRLKPGDKVLVTGCGLGDDLPYILEIIGPTGLLFAQDLSSAMIVGAQKELTVQVGAVSNLFFSVGDAQDLPFADNFFDAAFHFGGINLFDNLKNAIAEMERVVRPGGRVLFGDEGIAPWLKATEYGKVAICNNPLWQSEAPIALLPPCCLDVNLTWILGNCFYLIDFVVSDVGPNINMDVVHKGRRGGSMRTRYFGQLEGVDPDTRDKVMQAAAAAKISVKDWLEQAISKAL